jgi:hypothetical protein
MTNRLFIIYFVVIFALGGIVINSYASTTGIEGNISLWWDIYEQNENGVKQPRTGELAADIANGFALKKARATLKHENQDYHLDQLYFLKHKFLLFFLYIFL